MYPNIKSRASLNEDNKWKSVANLICNKHVDIYALAGTPCLRLQKCVPTPRWLLDDAEVNTASAIQQQYLTCWVAVKEPNLSYSIGETLFTMYTNYFHVLFYYPYITLYYPMKHVTLVSFSSPVSPYKNYIHPYIIPDSMYFPCSFPFDSPLLGSP